MKVVLFCHSLASCWNHGNAHFLRGICLELARRGHRVRAFEPAHGWSRSHLVRDHGKQALAGWRAVYPGLRTETYGPHLDLDVALDAADLVLVHEWTEPGLVAELGRRRAAGGRFRLLFHDTHHRAVSDPASLGRLPLDAYDGVLAFGAVLREPYLRAGWGRRVWTWHEAADTTVFHPRQRQRHDGRLIWIGNWGDGERSRELHRFLIEPVARLGLKATVHGVRYPEEARTALQEAGIAYGGWLPNHLVPERFAAFEATVHIPRRPYVEMLPGIPTIRVFEALACGIPLVTSPWDDAERLFTSGSYLMARSGPEMTRQLRALLHDTALRQALIDCGLEQIRARHTCAHRVDELLAILAALEVPAAVKAA
jgi:spore maturation protein CgeB